MFSIEPHEQGPNISPPFNNPHQAYLGKQSLDGEQQLADPLLAKNRIQAKKWLFYHTEEPPRTHYSDQDIIGRLATPDGYVDDSIFDGFVSDAGIRQHASGMVLSSWGRQRPPVREEHELTRTRLGFISVSRKAYAGPIYLQGQNPTCNAWTGIHALLAAGITPSLPFARDLLNAALPRADGKQGVGTFAVAGMFETHYKDRVAVTVPPRRQLSVPQVATLVKDAVDSNGAALATVKAPWRNGGDGYHAVCIAGYNICDRGYMDVQVIDSGCGVGALTVEGLARELNAGHPVPLAVVTKST